MLYSGVLGYLGATGDGGGEEDDGKANLRMVLALAAEEEESTRSGIPGDVLTVSVTTSSGSRINSSSWEISVT